MERFWEWLDEQVLFRDTPRLDAFLCHPWFLVGVLVVALGLPALFLVVL